jgi:hypothetical protein
MKKAATKQVLAAKAPAKKAVAKKAKAKAVSGPVDAATAIDARIAALGDWRGETLARLRGLIRQANAGIVEEWKWDVPVWSHHGILCTGETYRNYVKLTFAHGAALPDPAQLFNSSLGGNTRRAIDLRVEDRIDEKAFKALVKAAVAHNEARAEEPRPRAKRTVGH